MPCYITHLTIIFFFIFWKVSTHKLVMCQYLPTNKDLCLDRTDRLPFNNNGKAINPTIIPLKSCSFGTDLESIISKLDIAIDNVKITLH